MKELETILAGMKQDSGQVASDIVGTARALAAKAGQFLTDEGISSGQPGSHGVTRVAGSFGLESLSALGHDRVATFVEEAGVPEQYRQAACEEMKIILARAAEAGGNTASICTSHFSRVESTVASKCIGMESLLPDSMRGSYAITGGMEHFGVDTDKLEADLVTAITVSMMKWHNAIAPRLLPTIASVNPLVVYRRDEYLVFDLADSEDELTPVLALYANPDKVTNELKQIVPLATHDDIDTEGFIPVNKDINLFDVAKDAAKYGHGTTNRTDLVADNIRVDSILLSLTWDNGVDAAVEDELVEVSVPGSRGRLHRIPDAESTVRSVALAFSAKLTKDTLNVSGAASGALVGFFGANTDAYSVKFGVTPTVNIRTSNASAYGNITPSLVDAAGEAVTSGYTESHLTIALVGVKLDARYSEENFRKSSIISTQSSSELMYEVPPGRFYGADRSHLADASGEDRTRQIANLQRIAAIGQDSTVLKALTGYIDTVNDETAAYVADPKNNPRPGAFYAAGGKVNPSVVYADLDFTKIDSFDDSRRKQAIGGRVEGVLAAVVCDLMQKSKMKQQMGQSKLVFRALCSGEVLGKIIGMGTQKAAEASEGVEYAMELPDGTIVEFITTTFDSQGDDILMVPYLKDAPSSDLNFAHNRSCGTFVAAFTATHPDTASAERIMASVREAPLPTNIVGAIITVKGIDTASFKVDPVA